MPNASDSLSMTAAEGRTVSGRLTLLESEGGLASFKVGDSHVFGLDKDDEFRWLVGREVTAYLEVAYEGPVLVSVADGAGDFQCLATWDVEETRSLIARRLGSSGA